MGAVDLAGGEELRSEGQRRRCSVKAVVVDADLPRRTSRPPSWTRPRSIGSSPIVRGAPDRPTVLVSIGAASVERECRGDPGLAGAAAHGATRQGCRGG